jgi:outer membrane protein OmpA-like peptidoglycan-associated protein
MRKHIVLAAATAAALFISGCANMSDTQRRRGRAGHLHLVAEHGKAKREMEQATQGTGVNVSQTADNQLKLDIPSDISFDTNRSDIKGNFAPILDRIA